MKKIVALLLITGLFVSGCSLFKKDPLTTVNDALAKMVEVKKTTAKLLLSGTVKFPEGDELNSLQFSLDGGGKSDTTEDKSPKLDLTFTANMNVDGERADGEVLLKALDKKLYVSVKSLNVEGEQGKGLESSIAPFLDKWWFFPLSEESSLGKIAEQQKQVEEKFRSTKFFKSAAVEGAEDVQGVATTRYRVEVDKDAVKQFLVDVSRITENQLTPEEEGALADSLNEVEFSGLVSVGGDGYIHRIRGTVTVQPKQGASSSYDLDVSGWDYGKDLSVTAPEGAQEFNPFMALPLVGGGL